MKLKQLLFRKQNYLDEALFKTARELAREIAQELGTPEKFGSCETYLSQISAGRRPMSDKYRVAIRSLAVRRLPSEAKDRWLRQYDALFSTSHTVDTTTVLSRAHLAAMSQFEDPMVEWLTILQRIEREVGCPLSEETCVAILRDLRGGSNAS